MVCLRQQFLPGFNFDLPFRYLNQGFGGAAPAPVSPWEKTMTTMIRTMFSTAALLALGACTAPGQTGDRQALNGNTPGWTGRTFVVGSNSTVAGDAAATELQQKWGIGRER